MNILQNIVDGALGGSAVKRAAKKAAPLRPLAHLARRKALPLPTPSIKGAIPIRPGKTPFSPGEGPRIPRR